MADGGNGDPTRRGFVGLLVLGYSGLALLVAGWGLGFVKFLFPNATYEAPQKFKAGSPADYPMGSLTYLNGRRLWMARFPEGYAGIIAVCTHLGCKPNWHPERKHEVYGEGIFECPCHGSKFDRYGRNFAGPAPIPLWRATLKLGPDGRFVIDKSARLSPRVKVVAGEEVNQTQDAAFFLQA